MVDVISRKRFFAEKIRQVIIYLFKLYDYEWENGQKNSQNKQKQE